MHALNKVPRPVWILVLGGILLFPRLGSYGLWDPAETRFADAARDLADPELGSAPDTSQKKKPPAIGPPLSTWITALGFALFGVNELAARLPLAICGLLCLLMAYRVGRRLVGGAEGLTAALALALTPVFVFQSRQLTSDVVYYLCLVAGAGGLASYLWPREGTRAGQDLVYAGLGLLGGFLAKGLLLGVAYPLLGVALAVAVNWRTRDITRQEEPEDDQPADEPPLSGHDQPIASDVEGVEGQRATMAQALRHARGALGLTLAAVTAAIAASFALLENSKILLMGSVFRRAASPPTFDQPFRDLGWGTFATFALAPIALLALAAAVRASAEKRDRKAFFAALVITLSVLGYVLASIWPAYFETMRYPGLPWLAMGVGVVAYRLFRESQVHPIWGLAAAAIILVISQDYVVAPNSLAFSHLTESAKFPVELRFSLVVRLVGLALALSMFWALYGAPASVATPRISGFFRFLSYPLAGIVYLLNGVGLLLRGWGDLGRGAQQGKPATRGYWLTVVLLAAGFAFWCSWWLTPQLSLHMSNKALFETYHGCKHNKERLAQYMVTGRGATYYNNGQVDHVRGQGDLFKLLRNNDRAFVLIPSNQLAPIDRAARTEQVPYYVLDDRNSQYLIISNKLAGSCDKDLNPLRKWVVRTAPKMDRLVKASFENKVRLVGYDIPREVSKGGKFRMTLYYHVLDSVPANYKVFVHFDTAGKRFHGDHEPLGGKYPTQYWLKGDYIIDHHDVELPLLTTPSGTYSIYMGFWLGSQRLKTVEGGDTHNRINLGTIRIR
jgi:hypothetical protein